jgi:lambda family phage portal protein
MRANLLDRVIMALAPGLGLDRMRARSQAALLMKYDAASRGRRTSGWGVPATSADAAAYGGARATMRNLARDFVRNRPFAERGLSVISGNVVGQGIMPSVDAASDAAARRVREVIEAHLMTTDIDAQGQLNLPGMQRVAMRATVQDGEVLIRRRWRRSTFDAGLELPFQVELLEADYLDTALTSWGQNRVIDGVEYGPTGRAVAYHLFPEHPGAIDWRQWRSSVRVPAQDVIHVRRLDRPGQSRGVTWFAPVMLTLGDLSDYQEAEIVKQKMASLLVGFIESEATLDGAPDDPEAEADAVGLGEIGPGTITALPPGQKVEWSDPPQVQGYDQFTRHCLAAVAMGLGITYEALAGDLGRVNFSSARMGRIEMDRNVEIWQQQVMIDMMCRGLSRWFFDAWALSEARMGRLPDAIIEWTAPRRPLIDPLKEVPAILKKIDGGLSSRQREQRQLGLDPEQIARERVEDAARAGAPAADE